jgi:hypothetical protein
MIGLKTYLSTLAPRLGQTHDMLYERQRALVRHGLLESVEGHGRGSGVRADEKALAAFLISFLAHDILAHVSVAEIFCEMRFTSAYTAETRHRAGMSYAGKCPFTGAKNFRGALEAVLGHEPLAEKNFGVEIHRNWPGGAFLEFRVKNKGIVTSQFRHKPFLKSPLPRSLMFTRTSFPPQFMHEIAKDIAQFKKDSAS